MVVVRVDCGDAAVVVVVVMMAAAAGYAGEAGIFGRGIAVSVLTYISYVCDVMGSIWQKKFKYVH